MSYFDRLICMINPISRQVPMKLNGVKIVIQIII